jgi:Uma2 family endonuclease
MTTASRTLTLDEFLAEYEHHATLEYERGAITEKMPPTMGHGFLAMLLCQRINDFAYPRKLAFAATEIRTTDLQSGVSRVPDVCVYTWDRIERDPVKQQRGAFIPPDIAIEVASPGQSRRRQIERCQQFVALGARIALMVDPRTETIVDVRPGGVERRLRGEDVLDLTDVIPDLTLVVRALFAAARFE